MEFGEIFFFLQKGIWKENIFFFKKKIWKMSWAKPSYRPIMIKYVQGRF